MVPSEVEIGTFENWVEWREKVEKFSGIEGASRPVIRKILTKLNEEDVSNPEGTACIVLTLHVFVSICILYTLTALYSFYNCPLFS